MNDNDYDDDDDDDDDYNGHQLIPELMKAANHRLRIL